MESITPEIIKHLFKETQKATSNRLFVDQTHEPIHKSNIYLFEINMRSYLEKSKIYLIGIEYNILGSAIFNMILPNKEKIALKIDEMDEMNNEINLINLGDWQDAWRSNVVAPGKKWIIDNIGAIAMPHANDTRHSFGNFDLDFYLKLFIAAMVKGLKYIASRNIVHDDLQLRNIIFLTGDLAKPKIIDFSISSQIGSRVCSNPFGDGSLRLKGSTASDIQALGVILYELLTNIHWTKFNNIVEAINLPKENNIPSLIEATKGDKKLANLIHCMIEQDPKKRITLNQIKEHPFFK
jgi:hypothetical protein